MRNRFHIIIIVAFAMLMSIANKPIAAQERIVKVDFESNSFINQPKIPFDEPFIVQGEIGSKIEYVEIFVRNEGAKWNLKEFFWNRIEDNKAGTFNVVIPPVLVSNSKYDFEIVTYTKLSLAQKSKLVSNLKSRISYYINSCFIFDGKNVNLKNPKKVYKGLQLLIQEAFEYQVSKNDIKCNAPTKLVLNELKKQQDFKFKKVLRGSKKVERNDLGNELIKEKVDLITDIVISELMPFISSELVQHFRVAKIPSVSTDKEQFTLPVNVGMYAWNRAIGNLEDMEIKNTDFSFGAGITIPFSNKSKFTSRKKFLDSFGLSLGVLFEPIKDDKGIEYSTPRVSIPVYTALGIRLFKVIRLNAGVLIVGEDGVDDFKGLSITPTVGLALELDLWLGVKK